jgi:hypothetical protein
VDTTQERFTRQNPYAIKVNVVGQSSSAATGAAAKGV